MSNLDQQIITDSVRTIIAEYDSIETFNSALDASDMLSALVEAVRPLVATEHVEFNWSVEHGRCYDCGLPAAFYMPDAYGKSEETPRMENLCCAVCAANAASEGDRVVRIDAIQTS